MTVGEKIQHYRKKQGLSQEDLGQKLMVSRQTVSLWEMDKTVPSIDNLIRLKDIFGVSIDEILCEEAVKEDVGEKIQESYTVTYTKEAAKGLFKYSARSILTSFLISFFAFIFVFIASLNTTELIKGFVLGIIVLWIAAFIRTFFLFRKNRKEGTERMSQSTYTYDVFEDHLTVTITHPDKKRSINIKPEEIQKVFFTEKHIILQVSNELFALQADQVNEESRLYTLLKLATAKAPMPRAKVKWRALSIILFIASISSLILALLSVAVAGAINGKHVQNMWLFFLYLPIPIASIVFYNLLKRRGIVFKKNLIVGIIMSALLCIYGSFTLFPEQVSVNGVYAVSVENLLSETYASPDIIKVFSLKKADVHIETICIFKSADKGLVVGSLYTYEDENKTYFQEFESDLQIGKRYYSECCTCDYDIGYQIYETRKDAPDIAYELQEITVDGEKYYFCVGYIGDYMSDETHWVTE